MRVRCRDLKPCAENPCSRVRRRLSGGETTSQYWAARAAGPPFPRRRRRGRGATATGSSLASTSATSSSVTRPDCPPPHREGSAGGADVRLPADRPLASAREARPPAITRKRLALASRPRGHHAELGHHR